MAAAQGRLMEYAARGFQKEGLNDDQFAMIELIQLQNKIKEITERK
jgi:hypothetical protein